MSGNTSLLLLRQSGFTEIHTHSNGWERAGKRRNATDKDVLPGKRLISFQLFTPQPALPSEVWRGKYIGQKEGSGRGSRMRA